MGRASEIQLPHARAKYRCITLPSASLPMTDMDGFMAFSVSTMYGYSDTREWLFKD